MKVYVVENEDCSAVFSTKEKAIESVRRCANRCEWKEIETIDHGEWVRFVFAYKNCVSEKYEIHTVEILEYELDEEYNI